MLPGKNDASRSSPAGPPPEKITASPVRSSAANSSTSSTPSTFAPTLTLNADNTNTITQATKLHTYQGRSTPASVTI
jgi:hypothetical protein